MLTVAFKYHTVINDMTGNKTLKLCQYELDNDEWEVVKNLLQVLKVSTLLHHVIQQT
jgi:hypothetical protein